MSEERKFLHDISSPLAGSMMLIESVIATGSVLSDEDVGDLKKVYAALEKITALVEVRRKELWRKE